jgi:hypothetical protein
MDTIAGHCFTAGLSLASSAEQEFSFTINSGRIPIMTLFASNFIHLVARGGLYLLLGLSLAHCSPSDKGKEESTSEQADASTNADGDEANERENLMRQDGYRPGTLVIEVDMQQKGQGDENGMKTNWETNIQAKSVNKVWVVKDLRPFVSEEPDSDLRKNAIDYEPFSWWEGADDGVLSGNLTHAASFAMETNDSASIKRAATETGTVRNLHLQSLKPSLYGKGYDASITLEIDGKRQLNSTMSSKDLPQPMVENTNTDVSEKFDYILFPAPNADGKLNDYPYVPALVGDELKAQITQRHMETMDLLKQAAADSFPVQNTLRAGAVSEATKDQLIITYEYSGEKQLPFIISLDSFAGKASPNLLKIKITLKAGE